MKKTLITILIIVILAGAGYFAYTKGLINLSFLKKGSAVVEPVAVENQKEVLVQENITEKDFKNATYTLPWEDDAKYDEIKGYFIVPNKTFTMKDGSFTEGNPVVGNGVYCAIGGTFDVFETKFVGVSNSQLGVIDVYCNYGGTNTDVYLVAFKNIEGSLVQTDLINLQSESKFERFLNNVNLLSISEDNKIFVSALGDSYYLTNTAELKKDKLLNAQGEPEEYFEFQLDINGKFKNK